MALLKIIKNQKEVQSLELKKNKIYKVGRAPTNDIVLDQEPGISRLHFEIKFENGNWHLKGESRYGLLYVEDQLIEKLTLRGSSRFQVPPYEFEFSEEEQAVFQSYGEGSDDSEKTIVGGKSLVAQLKFIDHRGDIRSTFKLDGDSWIAGRDTSCAIFIDHQKMSRRHFEIKLQNGQYLIRDSGSSNGTQLNGQTLQTEEWTPLNSYDSISVSDLNFQFELRDPSYDQQVRQIDPQVIQPIAFSQNIGDENQDYQSQVRNPVLESRAQKGFKKATLLQKFKEDKKFKLITYSVIGVLFVGILLLLPDGKKETLPEDAAGKTKKEKSFQSLAPQQKEFIQQTYITGQQLLMQGKYELARQEMLKIHQIIPAYEESKQIEEMAELALNTLREKDEIDRKEKDRIQIEEKVQRQVQVCKKQMTDLWTPAQLDQCLSGVLALNPEHPEILQLKANLEQRLVKKSMQEAQNKDYREQVQKLKSQYQKATGFLEKEKYAEALKAFQNVSQLSLPDPDGLKAKAKRQVSSIQSTLSTKVEELEKKGDQSLKTGDLKNAILNFQKALEISGPKETVNKKLTTAQTEHRKLMQNLYQEGILEESVGEVDAAKGKWKKIMDQSYPGEDYYMKSQLKLKKYGL